MKTKEQITNLRRMFMLMLGPGVMFFSDNTIDMMANRLQDRINNTKMWGIKIRMVEQKDTPWEQIQYEPNHPLLEFNAISDKCYSLLIRFPQIDAIEISDGTNRIVFDRDH